MKENYPESDPEKAIFGAALNNLEIQPSEKFWSAALDGIIVNEKSRSRRQARIWRATSFILGTALILVIIHNIIRDSKLRKMEQEMTSVTLVETELKQKVQEMSQNEKNILTTSQPNSSNIFSSKPGQSPQLVVSNRPEMNNLSQSHYPLPRVQSSQNDIIVDRDTNSGRSDQQSVQSDHNGTQGIVEDNSANLMQNKHLTQISAPDKSVQEKQPVAVKQVTPLTDSAEVVTKKVNSVQDKADSTAQIAEHSEPKPHFTFKNKVSICAFFAPAIANDFLKDQVQGSDKNDNISTEELKSRQSDAFAYNTGIKLGFDLSNKFTLYSGLYYHIYSYDIRPTIVAARQQDNGAVGYSIVTSSGIVNIPYTGATPNQGDSISVRGSSSRGYMCIPLQLAYSIYARPRFRVSILAGLTADIVAYQGTDISWQDTKLQNGKVSVQSIEGLNRFYYGYSLGFGASYRIGKGFSVFAEPEMEGSVSSINNNTPVITYPYFFSVACGFTYHL